MPNIFIFFCVYFSGNDQFICVIEFIIFYILMEVVDTIELFIYFISKHEKPRLKELYNCLCGDFMTSVPFQILFLEVREKDQNINLKDQFKKFVT